MVVATDLVFKGFECKRCGHKWIPHDTNKAPRVCPKCKSPYWDIERKHVGKRTEQLAKDNAPIIRVGGLKETTTRDIVKAHKGRVVGFSKERQIKGK